MTYLCSPKRAEHNGFPNLSTRKPDFFLFVFEPLSADFVEAVFWRTLAHLHRCEPAFGGKRKGRRLLHRFKVKVHAVD